MKFLTKNFIQSNSKTTRTDGWYRNQLAVWITAVSVVGVIGLAITIILASVDRAAASQLVLTGVLPLLGVWVGTVLAYYFSKENFEAATRSVSELTRQLTSEEVLAAIIIKDVMINRNDMFISDLSEDKLILTTLLNELEKAATGNRIPILSALGQPKYVVHRSVIDRYLAEEARDSKTNSDIRKLTLKDLLADLDRKSWLEDSFATVSANDNLAIGKHAMDQKHSIQDIFVTTTGKPEGTVVGWVTNVIIADHTRVASG